MTNAFHTECDKNGKTIITFKSPMTNEEMEYRPVKDLQLVMSINEYVKENNILMNDEEKFSCRLRCRANDKFYFIPITEKDSITSMLESIEKGKKYALDEYDNRPSMF